MNNNRQVLKTQSGHSIVGRGGSKENSLLPGCGEIGTSTTMSPTVSFIGL